MLPALLLLCSAWQPAHATGADVLLRLEADDGGWLVWADNRLAGPVEVRLQSRHDDLIGEPELPARATVSARSSVLVARVHRANPTHGGALGLRLDTLQLDTVPGSVNARPRDYEYAFPLATRDLRVEQGWGGTWSHRDPENRYAVDFAAAIGTTVLAARDGVVMQVLAGDAPQIEADGVEAGGDSAIVSGSRGARIRDGDTLIRVLHDDGSMAVYAHLQPGSVLVQPAQRVRRGQPIALSGSSGHSTGPHLHFAVQVNRGMHLESIPFRMFSDAGILRFVEEP